MKIWIDAQLSPAAILQMLKCVKFYQQHLIKAIKLLESGEKIVEISDKEE